MSSINTALDTAFYLDGARTDFTSTFECVRRPGDETVTSSTPKTLELEGDKFAYWTKQRLAGEALSSESGGRGWADKRASGTTVLIFDVKDERHEDALKLAGTTVKQALSTTTGLHDMCVDLLDIYFWFIHPPDLSFLSPKPTAPQLQLEIEVNLVTVQGTQTYKLSEWGMKERRPSLSGGAAAQSRGAAFSGPHATQPLEMAVVQSIKPLRRTSVPPPPLRKVFYLMYRGWSTQNQDWEVKWTAEWVLSYCPFRGGALTRPEDPKAESDQGHGAGRVYWHGRLVPNTRIERVTWLQNNDAIRAINGSLTRARLGDVAARNIEATQTAATNENVQARR